MDTNPNKLIEPAKQKSTAQAAKHALDFLLKQDVIKAFDWTTQNGRIKNFLVWPANEDEDPLRLSPHEADAFCRGARAQFLKDDRTGS